MTGNGPFAAPSAGPDTDTGHGHVWPRPDGQVARCGGTTLCRQCKADAARWVQRVTWIDTAAPDTPGIYSDRNNERVIWVLEDRGWCPYAIDVGDPIPDTGTRPAEVGVQLIAFTTHRTPAPKLAAPPLATDWPRWAGTEPQEVDPDIDDLTQDELAEYAHTPELHAVAEALVHWFNHISGLRPGFARPHVGTFLEHLAAAGYRVVATDTPTEVERLQAELLAIAGKDPDLRTVYAYELGARDSDSAHAAAARTYLATQGGSIVVDVYPHGGGRIWLDQGNRRRELLADTFRSIDPKHPDVITQYVAETLRRLAQRQPDSP